MKNLIFLFAMIVGLGFTSCEKDAGPPPPPPPVDTTDAPPPVDTTTVPPVDTTDVEDNILDFKFVFQTIAPHDELDSITIIQFVNDVPTDTLVLLEENVAWTSNNLTFNATQVIGVNTDMHLVIGSSNKFMVTAYMNNPTYYSLNYNDPDYRFEAGTNTYNVSSGYCDFSNANGLSQIWGIDAH